MRLPNHTMVDKRCKSIATSFISGAIAEIQQLEMSFLDAQLNVADGWDELRSKGAAL